MKGDRIDHLNAGFAAFCASIAEDPLARKRTDVTVITFGGSVEVAVPFHEGRDLTPTTFGALKLVLGDGAYSWRFVDESGTTRDSGTATCH